MQSMGIGIGQGSVSSVGQGQVLTKPMSVRHSHLRCHTHRFPSSSLALTWYRKPMPVKDPQIMKAEPATSVKRHCSRSSSHSFTT